MKSVVSDKHRAEQVAWSSWGYKKVLTPACWCSCVCVCQTPPFTAYGQGVWVISMNACDHYCIYLGLKFGQIYVRLIVLPEKLIWVNVAWQRVCMYVCVFVSVCVYVYALTSACMCNATASGILRCGKKNKNNPEKLREKMKSTPSILIPQDRNRERGGNEPHICKEEPPISSPAPHLLLLFLKVRYHAHRFLHSASLFGFTRGTAGNNWDVSQQ